jgi:hypothetical protein
MSKPIDTFRLPQVRFLGEQKGQTEVTLTTKLSRVFASSGLVLRAYLVRVLYGDDSTAMNVVLAIRTKSGGEEQTLLPGINAAFASIFGAHEHLDILFLREDQEKAVRNVCQDFYGPNPALTALD